MVLSLTTIDNRNEYRDFCWWFERLETTFDVINSISSRGDQIISVKVIDNEHSVSLPIEAFDGIPCSRIVRQLEDEWKQVLIQPVNLRSLSHQRLIALTREQIKSQHTRIAQLTAAIEQLELWRQDVLSSTFTETHQMNVLSRTQMSVQMYQQHLANAQDRLRELLKRLLTLQSQPVNHLLSES